MTQALPPPAGVYVPVPTFFVSRTSSSYNPTTPPLDLSAQAAHSLHLARSGIRGLVLLGSTGEAVHLSHAERFSLLSSVRRAFEENGFKDYPLIAGTASNAIPEVISQLEQAKEAGVQWGLVLVPGYFAGATGQEGIVRWFTAVADASPIPVLVYHYPGVSNNVKVTPSTFATLAKHPNIVGCKLSHGDVSVHAQISASPHIDHTHFHTFTGLGQQLIPVLSVGAAGTIDGTAGFFPKSVVRLYELGIKNQVSEEEVKERRLLQYKVSSVEELVVKFGTIGIKEATSRVLGFGEVDGTRLPLAGGMGEGEWEKWTGIVEELVAVEKIL